MDPRIRIRAKMLQIRNTGFLSDSTCSPEAWIPPDPDPRQNVMDPHHWFFVGVLKANDKKIAGS